MSHSHGLGRLLWPVVGSCVHGNDLSGSIRGGELIITQERILLHYVRHERPRANSRRSDVTSKPITFSEQTKYVQIQHHVRTWQQQTLFQMKCSAVSTSHWVSQYTTLWFSNVVKLQGFPAYMSFSPRKYKKVMPLLKYFWLPSRFYNDALSTKCWSPRNEERSFHCDQGK